MRNRIKKIFGGLIWAIAVLAVVGGCGVIYMADQIRRVRFTVDALEQYVQSYQLVEHKPIPSLRELPDFALISSYDSLSLNSKDLKQGIYNGYIYDYQPLGGYKFVISASPVGVFRYYEFGITDKGVLRMNTNNIDAEADSYDEVEKWPLLTRNEKVRSKYLPAYLQ